MNVPSVASSELLSIMKMEFEKMHSTIQEIKAESAANKPPQRASQSVSNTITGVITKTKRKLSLWGSSSNSSSSDIEERSAASPQATLLGISDKFNGRTPVRVYFLDNSSKLFLLEPSVTVRAFCLQIMSKIGVLEANVASCVSCMALMESRDGISIHGMLQPEDNVVEVIVKQCSAKTSTAALVDDQGQQQEASAYKLLFMIRLFTPSLIQKALVEGDEALLHIHYLQAVFSVLTGLYQLDEQQALALGALHFQYKFGPFSTERHETGFLDARVCEFIPITLLKKQPDFSFWEAGLLRVLESTSSAGQAEVSTGDPQSAFATQRAYLDVISKHSEYGSTLFHIRDASPKVFVAISHSSVKILNKKRQVLHSLALNVDICDHCSFTKEEARFIVDAANSNDDKKSLSLVYATRDAQIMEGLVRSYAELLNDR